VAAALLFAFLDRSATGIELRTEVPSEVIIILQGVLILSIVVAFELVRRLAARRRLQETHERA
jgi:general nucleoside transport system permease protein